MHSGNGESGTVVLRVHVGPDGIPYSIDLVDSSHSRALDRAAVGRRETLALPSGATRRGAGGAAYVQVPIVFTADR